MKTSLKIGIEQSIKLFFLLSVLEILFRMNMIVCTSIDATSKVNIWVFLRKSLLKRFIILITNYILDFENSNFIRKNETALTSKKIFWFNLSWQDFAFLNNLHLITKRSNWAIAKTVGFIILLWN